MEKTVKEAKNNLQEAVELYLEDIFEAGDEKKFILRPAPEEEWLNFLPLLTIRQRFPKFEN